MTVAAIIESHTLVGAEIAEALEKRRDLCHGVRLLTRSVEAEGTVAEVDGTAALVQPLSRESLADVGLAFFCGDSATDKQAIELCPEHAVIVLVAPAHADAPLVVAGLTHDQGRGEKVVASPDPIVVGLAHLFHPVLAHELREVHCVAVQPASVFDTAGLDELFGQTRALLNFQTPPHDVFQHQAAFNVVPARSSCVSLLAQLHALFDPPIPTHLQILQGGIFHCLALSVTMRFATAVDPSEIRKTLDASPYIDVTEDTPNVGPIDIAGGDNLRIGKLDCDPNDPSSLQVWAVLDNLLLGTAKNAVDVAAEALTTN